jgi:tetratricopeptide (TPR) repeat protein
MDFGSGRPVGGGTAPVGGTPLYAAPEVLAGSPPAVASDIYSLGVLLFHLLTNRYPYEAEDLDGLRLAHADGQRQRLRELRPGLPAALVEVIEQALADDPAARFISASDLEVALARSVGLAPRPWSRATIVTLASAGTLGAAIVLGQLWASRPGTPSPPVVAVLPFTTSGPSGSPAFAAGLSDEIARTLQQYDLPVKLVTAEPTAAVKQQFVEAGVNELRGAVTREGKLTQVRAWLTDPRQRVRWSKTYTAWQADLPILKADIAGDLAAVLRVGPKSGPTPTAQHAPLGAAYDEYIAGRAKWYRRSSGSIKDALEHFNRAVHLDAEYAEAWSGISDANLTLGINAFGSLAPAEARRRAKGPALKALQLGENLAEVQTSLAFAAYLQDWDWVAAEEHFKRAIDLNGQYGLAHQWYSDFLTSMGRSEEARREIEEASRLEPMSILIERDRAWGPFMTGHYEEAVAYLRPIVAANQSFAPARTLLARCLNELGDYQEASELLAATIMPPRTRGAFTAYVQASSGDLAGARRLLQEVEVDRDDDYLSPYYIAVAYNALRDQPNALKWLQRALKEQDPMMVNMRSDFRLRNLRTEPEFQRILNVMNFPPY